MKTTLDLTIYPGLTFGPVEILCKDSAGAPVPLAGWSAFAEARAKPGAELLIDLTPFIFGGGTEGKVVLPSKAPAETVGLAPGEYLWEMILENPDGDRLPPLLGGRVSVKLTVIDAVNLPPTGS